MNKKKKIFTGHCIALSLILSVSCLNSDFRVRIANENAPQVEVENKFYFLSFRNRTRQIEKFGKSDFCIRDWFLKSQKQDQVDVCIDGSALRPVCSKIDLICDDENTKTIECTYGESLIFKQRYTFYRDRLYIKIDYVEYPTDWYNIVDLCTPGGITERYKAETRFYGQEDFKNRIAYHDSAYWNLHFDPLKDIYKKIDIPEKSSIVYKGHLIMAVGNPKTGMGFCRIMPVWTPKSGGIRTIKVLWGLGFETFPATGDQAVNCIKAFTGYIFFFNNGLDKAIEFGTKLVDSKQN